ncbi:MAG: hypothetical protein ACXAE3_16760 [Candidatus Kariarchaeaceae archaeon]
MSTRKTGRASYQCGICQKIRQLGWYDDEHLHLVSQSMNGLVTYSDIHICKDSLTGVNQLSVDAEYNVRTFAQLEVPKVRAAGNIPAPNTGVQAGIKLINVTQLPNDFGVHVVIHDYMILSQIKFGRFDHESEIAITTLMSDMGMIQLDIFPSGSVFTAELEQWLLQLVRILEILPATTLGLLVDTMRYISDNYHSSPTEFDLMFIKTILASHEVHFFIDDYSKEKLETLRDDENSVITDAHIAMIDKFVRVMMENEMASMRNFTSLPGVEMDLISIIYLFTILEAEGIIYIERPGILESY